MGEDLYNTNSSAPQSVAETNDGSGFFLDFGFDFDTTLYWLNIITFAWTLFYSIVFTVDFFFYRVKYNDGEVGRQKQGVLSINKAAGLWWGFLICVLLYFFYELQDSGTLKIIMGWVTAAAYLIKIFVADMPIIPIIGPTLGKPGKVVGDFLDDIATNSKKYLGQIVDGIVSAFGGSNS